ncbi:uncharacterized protein [Enoplosus armatus]|uniref:uncharacterized protein n=1 Tax=Enoplosus armatus TaxID=215367 RepID=UPI003991F179
MATALALGVVKTEERHFAEALRDGALAKCCKIVGHFKHSPANAADVKVQQASHWQEEESLVQDVPMCKIPLNKDPRKVSDVDPTYKVRIEDAFSEDLSRWRENTSLSWLKVATALDPRFKDLGCLPRAEREAQMGPEPQKKKMTNLCSLQWWSAHTGAHGKLAHIAQRYLATPASAGPCEFSLAGHVSALSSENVNKPVCLSNWLKEKSTS